MYKIGGSHHQCLSNHYAKFEYKRMKPVGFTQNRHPLRIWDGKITKLNTLKINEKIFIKCTPNGRSDLQCVSNHCVKFENKEMENVGVTDNTKIVSEYHQTIPQSQSADNPMAS